MMLVASPSFSLFALCQEKKMFNIVYNGTFYESLEER